MGHFKGIESDARELDRASGTGLGKLELSESCVAESRSLFEDFDPASEGGIAVTSEGQLFELRHPYWAEPEATVVERSIALPYRLVEDEIVFEGPVCDFEAPTMGGEFEIAVEYDGKPWHIASDGVTIQWPDGTTDVLTELGFTPEALGTMLEFDSGVATSFADFCHKAIGNVFVVEYLLENYELDNAGLSLTPYAFTHQDRSTFPYVQKTGDRMPGVLDFGVMSNQLTMQVFDPEAAQYALNEYQELQAVISLLTAAAPIRDGSFDTTIGEHYNQGQLPAGDYAHLYEDERPYDWRELARVVGSPSAGTFRQAAPVDTYQFLRQADAQLRDGTIPTSGRTLGWHTDRLREQGRVEICNIATAGGNLHKLLATQELVSKYFIAKQLEYLTLPGSQRQQRIARHQAATEVGHVNNINVALHGKGSFLTTTEGQPLTPAEALQELIEYVDTHAPSPLSPRSKVELTATMSDNDTLGYQTIDELFALFFQPNSPLTATEALRRAHQLEPGTSTQAVLKRYSDAKRQHIYSVAYRHGFLTDWHGSDHLGIRSLMQKLALQV